MTVAWAAYDAHSGVAAATLQWRQGRTWRSLGSAGASDGAGSMAVDVVGPAERAAGRAAGRRRRRRQRGVQDGDGGDQRGGRRQHRLRPARPAPHRPPRWCGSRARASQRAGAGPSWCGAWSRRGAVTIRGVLLDRSGRADRRRRGAGARVSRPRDRAWAHTSAAAGSPSLRGRTPAGSSGSAWRRAGSSCRAARDATVRLEVRPRLEFASSSDAVSAGGTVLFSGRLSPSPGDLGFGSRKTVVLEWLDPLRRTWRPVVNARLRRDGTFAIPWAFNLRGLTIPMRVTVPQDVGWPLLAATSRTVRVRVT